MKMAIFAIQVCMRETLQVMLRLVNEGEYAQDTTAVFAMKKNIYMSYLYVIQGTETVQRYARLA